MDKKNPTLGGKKKYTILVSLIESNQIFFSFYWQSKRKNMNR